MQLKYLLQYRREQRYEEWVEANNQTEAYRKFDKILGNLPMGWDTSDDKGEVEIIEHDHGDDEPAVVLYDGTLEDFINENPAD